VEGGWGWKWNDARALGFSLYLFQHCFFFQLCGIYWDMLNIKAAVLSLFLLFLFAVEHYSRILLTLERGRLTCSSATLCARRHTHIQHVYMYSRNVIYYCMGIIIQGGITLQPNFVWKKIAFKARLRWMNAHWLFVELAVRAPFPFLSRLILFLPLII
jgi:hypothetical protein